MLDHFGVKEVAKKRDTVNHKVVLVEDLLKVVVQKQRIQILALVVLEVLVVLVVLEHIKSKFELTTGLELATGLELGLATELGTEPLITLLAAHLEQVQLEREEEIITISF